MTPNRDEEAKRHAKERARRINGVVRILDMLEGYGYQVRADAEIEQQFSCDLHGDGQDSKPSARVYPDTNSMYCFACSKSRTPVSLFMEKEGVGFSEACFALEKMYGLPHYMWRPDEAPVDPRELLSVTLAPSFEEEARQTSNLLLSQTRERVLSSRATMSLWELFDMVSWRVGKGELDERTGQVQLAKLRAKVISMVSDRIQSSMEQQCPTS